MSMDKLASSSTASSATANHWQNLRTKTISVILKFGFQQLRLEYPVKDVYNSIVEHLYRDAEKWLYDMASHLKSTPITGRFTIYLFRIPSTEFTMVPIVQPSDIEQNAIIEIILVPAETDLNPHSLYRCQLNKPTYCSKCSRFITGLIKQGFRCRKCRMTYHKECAPFLLYDCAVQASGDQTPTQKKTFSQLSQLIIFNPFFVDSKTTADSVADSESTAVDFHRLTIGPSKDKPLYIASNVIIDKGIYPACVHGTNFHQRYCFYLTQNSLIISAKLSANQLLPRPPPSTINDIETTLPLTDIADVILTHFMEDRDDIFEIHLKDNEVISVGKKSDSNELQMKTAQFYSFLRDQRDAVIAAASLSNIDSTAAASQPEELIRTTIPEKLQSLVPSKSIFRKTTPEKDSENKDQDLHELYAFTHEKLGQGTFGTVVGGYRKSTQRQVAIKVMEKANCTEKDISKINGEISKLDRFDHQNILKLEAYFERDNAVYIITERMEADLCNYIMNSPNGYLDEDMCRIILYQVIVALRYLHSKNCGHLDVKCDNILLRQLRPIMSADSKTQRKDDYSNQDLPLIKLADFGYSEIIGEHSFRKSHVGTKVYNAPEIYHSAKGYNRSADMWSAGIVLYASLSGMLPFEEKDALRAVEIVQNKRSMYGGDVWSKVSKAALDLLSNKLLVPEPTERIKPNEALFHDWFCEYSLYRNLRDIEKRTKEFLISQKQEPPAPLNWLTYEREDPVWIGYQDMHAEMKRKK